MLSTLPGQLLLALLIGAAIGLERERSGKKGSATSGVRTFAIASLLGAIAGYLYLNNFSSLALFIAGSVSVLIVAYYIVGSLVTKDVGPTTEIAIITTFVIGALTTLGVMPLELLIALSVAVVAMLSLKAKTQKVAAGVSGGEMQSFVGYAIIALIVFPFLPNYSYKVSDIPIISALFDGLGLKLGAFSSLELVNPQRIWMIVVLITGIDVFGYLMGKLISKKNSFTLTSFVGGFVSSTVTTLSLGQKSKQVKGIDILVGAALLANLASFLQIFMLVGPLNSKWLVTITPSILIMVAVAGVLAWYFLRKGEATADKDGSRKGRDKIFSLLPALKFAALLMAIKVFTKVFLILFGKTGFVGASVIASFAGLDAIVVTLAEMAGSAITLQFALLTLLIVNGTNLISKAGYALWQADRGFATKLSCSMLVVIFASFAGLLFA